MTVLYQSMEAMFVSVLKLYRQVLINVLYLVLFVSKFATRPRGYNTIFMLNSTEYEISTSHKN